MRVLISGYWVHWGMLMVVHLCSAWLSAKPHRESSRSSQAFVVQQTAQQACQGCYMQQLQG
jgi:hypothetical protein